MSDIKMVGTMSESIQRIYKGSKKYKIQTKEVKFKNKKNEFCSIERDDLVERLETSLTTTP